MQTTSNIGYIGLDLEATGRRISRYIDESGLRDKEIGAQMSLSVQSINKWRHGRCLQDIENLYILGQILGKKVDDFLVPVSTHQSVLDFAEKAGLDPASSVVRLLVYAHYLNRRSLLRTGLCTA